ncbi:hypothetical protein [Nonomuraea typhae]|uniref:hypothetical protein n=1 Tax=Nonomuraea typhae TaxID=2603600 RepID=UPI0012F9EE24|nr:hypothetical protein [Nonomuraea typhae]
MALARRVAAVGAVVAFVAGGVSIAAGVGTAAAESDAATALATCLPIPLIPCEEPSGAAEDPWSSAPNPVDSWSGGPQPEESWSEPAPQKEPEHPWKPVDEDERKVPSGHPETGAGGLARESGGWPFAIGGAALLAGAGLAGIAVSAPGARGATARRDKTVPRDKTVRRDKAVRRGEGGV